MLLLLNYLSSPLELLALLSEQIVNPTHSSDLVVQDKGKGVASVERESKTARQRQDNINMVMKLTLETDPSRILAIDSTEDKLFLRTQLRMIEHKDRMENEQKNLTIFLRTQVEALDNIMTIIKHILDNMQYYVLV